MKRTNQSCLHSKTSQSINVQLTLTLFENFGPRWRHINGERYIYYKAPSHWKSQEIRHENSKVVYDIQQNEIHEGNIILVKIN